VLKHFLTWDLTTTVNRGMLGEMPDGPKGVVFSRMTSYVRSTSRGA